MWNRGASSVAGVREKIEMSEQQLVSAHEVNASPLEEQPMARPGCPFRRKRYRATACSAPNTSCRRRRGPVVKLFIGQELHGTVKRITEFGAFVDIGVGHDRADSHF
jgi:polyribonucleotide nucleotidyltransferase